MSFEPFKPHHHIPRFSRLLLRSLWTPLLIYFALLGNVLTFSAAYVFYRFELPINPAVQSYWDAAWWALCTVSTVGYGDIVPTTVVGRLVGVFLILVGVTFFMGFMAVLVTVLSTLIGNEKKELKKGPS